MASLPTSAVDSFRGFNRFYTRQLGLLEKGLLGSGLLLSEARIVYELAQRPGVAAVELAAELSLDAGYFSRLLRGLERRGLIERRSDPTDGRRRALHLSKRGRLQYLRLDRASQAQIDSWLKPLCGEARAQLLHAMQTVSRLLGGAPPGEVVLRDLRVGDLGWIARRQGQVYAAEYGWDVTYEALAAEILAGFVRQFDAAKEQAWIAERDAEIVGSVFLMRVSDEVAKLRLLYVEPTARGSGLGRRLVDECIAAARSRGYRALTLWTQNVLVAARRTYQAAGFQLTSEEPQRLFGQDLISQIWSLEL